MHAQLSKLIMAGNHDRAIKLVEAARGQVQLKPWAVPVGVIAIGLLFELGTFLAR